MRVSAKRLFPTYEFLDAPFNKPYYKAGDIRTELATMGCVDGKEIIAYKKGNKVFTEDFKTAWNNLTAGKEIKTSGLSNYVNLNGVSIYDSTRNDFVECKKIIMNPDRGDWYKLTTESGRTLFLTSDHPLSIEGKGRTYMRDISLGDKVHITNKTYSKGNTPIETGYAWLLGASLCDGRYYKGYALSLGLDEKDIANYACEQLGNLGYASEQLEKHRGERGDYLDVVIRGEQKSFCDKLLNIFKEYPKRDRCLPADMLSWSEDARRALLCGMIDADGHINARDGRGSRVHIGSTNSKIARGQMLLALSLGINAKMYLSTYGSSEDKIRYKVEFPTTDWMKIYLQSEKKKVSITHHSISKEVEFAKVTKIEYLGCRNEMSYDVETESDRFDVSGFASHNCRTRVIGNVYDPTREVVTGRGNASFTSINLPRLGIESHGDIDLFFEMLEDRMYLVKRQITKRFKLQGTKKVKNYPFLMGQGIWLDSDKLGPEDTIEEIICHASLSIGFIGLAECLTALIGKHHGQSKEAQELGLKVIGRMRELADLWQKEDYELSTGKKVHLNWSILATPAEGLSGTFVRKDKKKYGKIKGVTDKDYYTNSVHIPVGFKIGFAKKIKLEAPYHALCNAGHIMYCEFDGDATQNLEAFESIIRCMKENGVGYGAINVPVDRDPVCGYTGIIGDVCPKCGRNVTESISQDEINEIRRKFGMPCSYNLSSSCCN